MREPLKDKNRLEHIIDAIDTILSRTERMELVDLTADKIVFGGIVYQTMIIGEAAYKLSPSFMASHPEVPWQDIADMRHHLVHGYYQVNAEIIWSVIKNDLEPLRDNVKTLLSETNWEQWEQNNV